MTGDQNLHFFREVSTTNTFQKSFASTPSTVLEYYAACATTGSNSPCTATVQLLPVVLGVVL